MQSLRRRVWATRFFENSVPDAFDAHFFNGLLKLPDVAVPRKQTIEFGINYCLDGLPPKSLL